MIESFVAGAAAGLSVDLLTYPLDTIKTRLQSNHHNTLHPRRLYNGVGAMLTGSVPSAALFFACFDTLTPVVGAIPAAVVGETVSCAVRVPVEVVKQRLQVGPNTSGYALMREIYRRDGVKGFYVGGRATLMRDLPFAVIQYPLYNMLTKHYQTKWADGVCGAVSGGIAALITHPMDVFKTRSIVFGTSDNHNPFLVIRDLHRNGLLFCGIRQRVAMFTVGGFIYFGAYSFAIHLLSPSSV